MNDKKISEWFNSGQVNKAFTRLYSQYPKVEKYILQNSGSKDEALDIFQEGLILLYRKYQEDQSISYEGFLINSCKFLWKNELRKKKVRQGDDSKNEFLTDDNELSELLEKEQKFRQIEDILQQISKKCRTIFTLFYYKSMNMTQVAKAIGFKSVQSAKVQKYKCMVHARNLAMNQSLTKTPKS